MKQEDFLTIPEAARSVSRTTAAIYAAIKAGRLEAQTVFGKMVVSRANIEAYKARTEGVGFEGGRPFSTAPKAPRKQKAVKVPSGRKRGRPFGTTKRVAQGIDSLPFSE